MAQMLLNQTEGIQGNDTFDFESWIAKFQLTPIKHSFIELEMNTLSTLTMDNENFSKLMMNQKVLIKSHLIPNIIKGIQSLKSLQHQEPQNKLIFLTQPENKVFICIQDFMDELNKFDSELRNNIKPQFVSKTKRNLKKIQEYKQHNIKRLDQITGSIHDIFKILHEQLNDKEKTLKCAVEKYKKDLNEMEEEYKSKTNQLHQTLMNSIDIIASDKQYYIETKNKCREIINQYHDKQNNYDFKHKNEERENEIGKVGKIATDYHQTQINILDEHKSRIQNFINEDCVIGVNDSKTDLYLRRFDESIYNQIIDDLENMVIIEKIKNPMKNQQEQYPKIELPEKQMFGRPHVSPAPLTLRLRGRGRRRGRGRNRGRGNTPKFEVEQNINV